MYNYVIKWIQIGIRRYRHKSISFSFPISGKLYEPSAMIGEWSSRYNSIYSNLSSFSLRIYSFYSIYSLSEEKKTMYKALSFTILPSRFVTVFVFLSFEFRSVFVCSFKNPSLSINPCYYMYGFFRWFVWKRLLNFYCFLCRFFVWQRATISKAYTTTPKRIPGFAALQLNINTFFFEN